LFCPLLFTTSFYKRDPIYQGYRFLVILALLYIMPHPTTPPWTLLKPLDLFFWGGEARYVILSFLYDAHIASGVKHQQAVLPSILLRVPMSLVCGFYLVPFIFTHVFLLLLIPLLRSMLIHFLAFALLSTRHPLLLLEWYLSLGVLASRYYVSARFYSY